MIGKDVTTHQYQTWSEEELSVIQKAQYSVPRVQQQK
jgi:hypothetical protein